MTEPMSFARVGGTWLALLVLLGATVGVAYVPLGIWNAVLALGIAGAKAVLIVRIFMHVRQATRTVTTFAVVSLLWLTLLFITVSDYLSRGE